MDQTDVSALLRSKSQIEAAIKAAFLAWVFMPVLCRLVGHGEIVLKIHDSQLRDVRFPIDVTFRTDSTT